MEFLFKILYSRKNLNKKVNLRTNAELKYKIAEKFLSIMDSFLNLENNTKNTDIRKLWTYVICNCMELMEQKQISFTLDEDKHAKYNIMLKKFGLRNKYISTTSSIFSVQDISLYDVSADTQLESVYKTLSELDNVLKSTELFSNLARIRYLNQELSCKININ